MSKPLDFARMHETYALVPEVAERFLEDNSDFSAELKFAIRMAGNTATSKKDFWKKVEVAMSNIK